jgi:hypothetical protein
VAWASPGTEGALAQFVSMKQEILIFLFLEERYWYLRFEVFAAATMKNAVFWMLPRVTLLNEHITFII